MLLPLTEKQRKVFEVLSKLYVDKGYPPTQQEVSDIVVKASVSGEIRALRKKGWLASIENFSRRNVVPSDEALEKFTQMDFFMEKRM